MEELIASIIEHLKHARQYYEPFKYIHLFNHHSSHMTLVIVNVPILQWRKLKRKEDFKVRFCCV